MPTESITIPDPLRLPPGFEAIEVAPGGPDPFAAAVAEAGAEPGRLYWDLVGGALRVGVVLAPDRAVSEETLGELMLLVAFDTLATLAPPQVPVSVVLPATLLLDGARVGAVRTALGPGDVPHWAMAGVELALRTDQADPGHAPNTTSMEEEGFGPVAANDVLEQVARHLLVWVDTWKHEGDGLSRVVARRMQTLDDLQERT